MKPFHRSAHDDLICTASGYKPRNMHKWGPGVRDIHALHYVVSGKGYLETNETTYPVKAGESFIIYPHTEVYYYPDPQDPWEYVWVDFRGEEADRLLSMTRFAPDRPVAPEAPDNLAPFFQAVETAGVQPFERVRSNATLRLLLSYYLEYCPREEPSPPRDYVFLARAYIENNYWRPELTVQEVVRHVKIERSYLFRLFKEATGLSISGYVAAFRLQRACELLQSSDLSVKSVAYSVGYQDPLYFSKIFKKATSYTPSEYKRLHLGTAVR